MSDRFYYWRGLRDLAERMQGTERLMMGCRPYGFHAGNLLSMVAYPLLLAQLVQDRDIEVRFEFQVSFNDLELSRPQYSRQYPYCLTHYDLTTFQNTPDNYGCCSSESMHWQKIIRNHYEVISESFPHTSVTFTCASEMLGDASFFNVLLRTINNQQEVAAVIQDTCGYRFPMGGCPLAGALCPQCGQADGMTHVAEDQTVVYSCRVCQRRFEGEFSAFRYWMNHLPLGVAKEAHLRSDLWITGGDYLSHNLYDVYGRLAVLFGVSSFFGLRHLISPVVLGSDGRPMHKSNEDAYIVPLGRILASARENPRSELSFAPE